MCRILVASGDEKRTSRLKRAFSTHPDAALLQVETCALPEVLQRLGDADTDAVDVLFIDVATPPDPYAGVRIVAAFEADHANVPDDALPQVVYLSSREAYTSMIHQTRHCYLLLDPLSPDKIRDALRKALASKIRPSVPLALKSAGTVHVLFPKDIVIVKSVGRKVLVFCVGGQQHEAYAALSDIEDRLPETFVRCHKSYLVNMELASSMGNGRAYHARWADGPCEPASPQGGSGSHAELRSCQLRRA